jgi:hypothetical protein
MAAKSAAFQWTKPQSYHCHRQILLVITWGWQSVVAVQQTKVSVTRSNDTLRNGGFANTSP